MTLPKVVLTAPERIWLQVSDQEYDKDVDFPIDSEVTWCQDSVVETEVEYVRKDLAQPVDLTAIREVIEYIKIEISDDGTTIVKDYRMSEWADELARAIGDKP